MLLMCGGVLGLGYYAVERMATTFNEVNLDYMDEDTETPMALQYTLSENEVLKDQIGDIESVDFDEALNENNSIYTQEYFYRVQGSTGEAIVYVQISDAMDEWFSSVELVTDETDLENRVVLDTIAVPFDSTMAKTTYNEIVDDETIAEQVGTIVRVEYDWDMTEKLTSDFEASYVFLVKGSEDETYLRVTFTDYLYDEISKIESLEDEDNPVVLLDRTAGDASE